jgi:hypothetical protein
VGQFHSSRAVGHSTTARELSCRVRPRGPFVSLTSCEGKTPSLRSGAQRGIRGGRLAREGLGSVHRAPHPDEEQVQITIHPPGCPGAPHRHYSVQSHSCGPKSEAIELIPANVGNPTIQCNAVPSILLGSPWGCSPLLWAREDISACPLHPYCYTTLPSAPVLSPVFPLPLAERPRFAATMMKIVIGLVLLAAVNMAAASQCYSCQSCLTQCISDEVANGCKSSEFVNFHCVQQGKRSPQCPGLLSSPLP